MGGRVKLPFWQIAAIGVNEVTIGLDTETTEGADVPVQPLEFTTVTTNEPAELTINESFVPSEFGEVFKYQL